MNGDSLESSDGGAESLEEEQTAGGSNLNVYLLVLALLLLVLSGVQYVQRSALEYHDFVHDGSVDVHDIQVAQPTVAVVVDSK